MSFEWLDVVIGSLFLVVILTWIFGRGKSWLDPAFWRIAAIVSTLVMTAVLIYLTFDSLKQISVGSARVPSFTVINRTVAYAYDASRLYYVPQLGEPTGLFGKVWDDAEAEALIHKGKKTIQGRNCMACHTLLGNGAYYAPDLTKAWLDPKWETIIMPMTQTLTKEEAIAKWLQSPDRFPTFARRMPNLNLSEEEARAVVAYLKYMATIDTNGFPDHFGISAGP